MTDMYIGDTRPSALYVGNDEALSAYIGDTLVWSKEGGDPEEPEVASLLAVSHDTSPFLMVIDHDEKVEDEGWPSVPSQTNNAAWSPNGEQLVLAHASSSFGDGTPLFTVIDTTSKSAEEGWDNWVPSGANQGVGQDVAFSPDGSLLALVSFYDINQYPTENRLRVYDTSTKALISDTWDEVSEQSRGVAFSPDGARIAVSHIGGAPYYRVIDVASGNIETGWPDVIPSNASVIAWSPDGTKLAIGHDNSPYVTVFDVATKTVDTGFSFTELKSRVQALSWSPDGAFLGVGQWEGPIVVFDLSSEQESVYGGNWMTTRRAKWSPDSRLLGVTIWDTGSYDLLDVVEGTFVSGLPKEGSQGTAIAFQGDAGNT